MEVDVIQMLETGLFEIPEKEYFALPDLSASGLKHAAKSWAHFEENRKNPPEPTKAMILGKALHLALEYPSDWPTRIIREEKWDGRTKEGKAKKEEFQAKHAGKLILPADDFERLEGMFQAVTDDEEARQYVIGGKAEVVGRWKHAKTGVKCKARMDRLLGDVIVDYKTCEDASAEAVARTMYNLKYHWQSAFYLDGLSEILGTRCNKFVHIFVEKSPPYGVQLFYLDDMDLDLARQEYEPLIEQYAHCLEEDFFPSYPKGLQLLKLPEWAWKRATRGVYEF